MVILALDTTTRTGSLGLWIDGVAHGFVGTSTRTHAERLPLEVLDWLVEHGLDLPDVELVAVVSGPGSFTGLRVGLATAQGLALPSGIPTLGIPTLEAVAVGQQLAAPAAALVVPCVDAQRGEVFFAAYRTRAEVPVVGSSDQRIGPAVGSVAELCGAVQALASDQPVIVVVGNDPGARRHIEAIRAGLPGAAIVASDRVLAADAALIASTRLADGGSPHALRPLYVRRPDVELARDRQTRPVA